MSIFKDRLNELLTEKKINQIQFANMIKVQQPTVNRYLKGLREPDLDTLIKICKILDVSSDFLLGLIDY